MTLYGRTIDAYHIGRLLGRGSFGDVYEARCQHSGQLVAIKMISKELLHNQGLLERITREVEIHCQLQHPHIVELFEYFEDDRRVYLVMELCKNGELLALLRKHGRFDASTARAFFSQLVDGVTYLHSHSILHRDLKLSNLLLSADNTLKIADFGLAAAIGANDPERRTICGTPNYMCPEIVEQQPYSLAADLWSLGVTLYTLLTGTPPFQSDAVRGTLRRVGCADYLLPQQLAPEAADLITQLLQKDPARRIPLSAIQSHPFLVGRPMPPPEAPSDRPMLDSRLPKTANHALSQRRSSHVTRTPPGRSAPLERVVEEDRGQGQWSEESDHSRSGGFPTAGGVEMGGMEPPSTDNSRLSHGDGRGRADRADDRMYEETGANGFANEGVQRGGEEPPRERITGAPRDRAERLGEADRAQERMFPETGPYEPATEGGVERGSRSGNEEGPWNGQRDQRGEESCERGIRNSERHYEDRCADGNAWAVTDPVRDKPVRFAQEGDCRQEEGSSRSSCEATRSRASECDRNGQPLSNERGSNGQRREETHKSRDPPYSSSRPATADSFRGDAKPHLQVQNMPPESPAQLPTRPLSTLRLKALRHETSYGSLAILDDGRVQVRITGPKESVISVSPDGLKVEVEQSGRPAKSYRFPALPDVLLTHYAHAAAFVGIVASATPKVLYIFERGQATTMENGDLQVCFTDCKPATLLHFEAASGTVTLTPPSGPLVTLPSLHSRPTDFQNDAPTNTWHPSEEDTWLWEALSIARRCQRKCAEAEARAIARQPPKTFPLVARSARLKAAPSRGGADATVALASAAPPAQVERAAELVAAVQGLHSSLLPANVSIASAQELSFASSSSSSSHLQPAPGFASRPQASQLPILRQLSEKPRAHSPSSPLSPNPSLHSLPETPRAREGSSLKHVSEPLPSGSYGSGSVRPINAGNVAEQDELAGDRWAHSNGNSEGLPKRPFSQQQSLVSAAHEPARQGGATERTRATNEARTHVAYDQLFMGDVAPVQNAGRLHTAPRATGPPQLDRNFPKASARLAETARGQEHLGQGRRADAPGRVLADVSNNRELYEAQNARHVQKAKEGPTAGLLDGVRRRQENRPEGLAAAGQRSNGVAGATGRSEKAGFAGTRLGQTTRLADAGFAQPSRREKLPSPSEGFKVFEDRELRPQEGLPGDAAPRTGHTRGSQPTVTVVGSEPVKPVRKPLRKPVTDGFGSERFGGELQAPVEPPSARSYSDTWQDLGGANTGEPGFGSVDPLSDTWQALSGLNRAQRKTQSASPSSDTWQDGRSEDPFLEGFAAPPSEKQAPGRTDARSYVASNRPVDSTRGSSVTTKRSPALIPLPPLSARSPDGSLSAGALPLSPGTREFLNRPLASGSEAREDVHRPPALMPAAQNRSIEAVQSRPPFLPSAAPRELPGRPAKGPDGGAGRQSAYFPGVGWAIRLKSGELLMHYLDDCQMVVSNDGATVEFWPPGAKLGGSKYKLSDRSRIPQEVRDKLQHLGSFIKLIRKQSRSTHEFSNWATPRTFPVLAGE